MHRILYKNLISRAMLVFVISAITSALYTNVAFCSDSEFKVINVKNVVRLDSKKDKSYKDYYLNYGARDGAAIGDILLVHRLIKKRSEVEGIPDKMVSIPIGNLKIISFEDDSSIARLLSLSDRAQNPVVEYNTVMIGDVVTKLKTLKESTPDIIPETVILPESVLFDFNKYTLKKAAKGVLASIGAKIAQSKSGKIVIDGHTDSIGDKEYNQKLSKKRASSVFTYFTKELGIAESLFEVNGYGESMPIAGNDTAQARQRNRRVEITLY